MLKAVLKGIAFLPVVTIAGVVCAQSKGKNNAIYSGVPWFDKQGNIISAHGGGVIKDNNRFYFFGERHYDTSNAFAGFNCYSSNDLYTWQLEGAALPVQKSGKLGPDRVGERPKVMKCEKTGEYILFMHADTLGYKDQYVGYATAENITGPYTFKGPLLFNGQPIKKWDMGVFKDYDGAGYVLIHGGEIYKLSDDFKSIAEQVNKNMTSGFEAPVLFRKDSIYFFIGSHLSSWERNDNYYYTATALKGPWTKRGLLAPEGSLTWNSQATFVLPVTGTKDTSFIFMGDRWAYPKQASAATYVWQPLNVSGTGLSMPEYNAAWKIDATTGVASSFAAAKEIISMNDKRVIATAEWYKDSADYFSASKKNAAVTVKLKARQIGFLGLARPEGGYALVSLTDSKGKKVLSAIVDMYCKYPVSTLKFMSPVLPVDSYTLTVTVMEERGNWSDKRKANYGSTGYVVSLDKIIVNE